MKTKQIILLVMFSLVFAMSVNAAVNTLIPNIEINFTEKIDITTLNVTLIGLEGELEEIERTSPDELNPIFIYRPTSALQEGIEYTVRAEAEDEGGNPSEPIILTFTIELDPMLIGLVNPRHYHTPTQVFNFIINTTRHANCRFSRYNAPYYAMDHFEETGEMIHYKNNYSIPVNPFNAHIICNDTVRNELISNLFVIHFDASRPNLIASADPNPVIEEDFLYSTLIAQTDDPTICRYSANNETNYTLMGGRFSEEEYAFSTRHTKLVQIAQTQGSVDFYVACNNSAGLLSDTRKVSVYLSLDTGLSIRVNSPTGYASGFEVIYNVTPNKQNNYFCELADNTEFIGAESLVHSGKDFWLQKTYTQTGAYTRYIRCLKGENVAQVTVSFSIDNTVPVMTNLTTISPLENESSITYDDDELCAEWSATDAESGISQYRYYVYLQNGSNDELIESGNTNANEECVDVDLIDLEKYYWKVKARNGVGLWSTNKTSSDILLDISLSPVSCTNDIKDGDEKGIDCGGACTAGCEIGVDCDSDSDCDTDYCGSNSTCQVTSCSDNQLNGAESDTDCGGTCSNDCDIGENCDDDNDCDSNSCSQSTGLCEDVVDSCSNHVLDIDETDEDCGGNCPRCDTGFSCDINDDCVYSADCVFGICTTRPQDSDSDTVDDSIDNCPFNANTDQLDVDSDGKGNVCDDDSDNDGLPDSFEQQYFNCDTCAESNIDSDDDGLTNLEEMQQRTNPKNADTDGDGISDGEEVSQGTNPLDPNDKPGNVLPIILLILAIVAVLGVGGFFFVTQLLPKMKSGNIAKSFKPLKPLGTPQKPPITKPIISKPPITKPTINKLNTKTSVQVTKPASKGTNKKIVGIDVFKRLKKISNKQLTKRSQREWYPNVKGVSKGSNGKISDKLKKVESSEKDLDTRLANLKKKVSKMKKPNKTTTKKKTVKKKKAVKKPSTKKKSAKKTKPAKKK
jgi:hypothetical protein